MRKLARLLGIRNPVPRVRRRAGRLRTRVRDWWRGETAHTLFDLHDLRELNVLLTHHSAAPPLAVDPREAEAGVAGATRFAVAVLAAHPRLRRRFPAALSAGPDGPFGRWLTTRGAARFGLSPAAVGHVRAAFAAAPGTRARRVYEIRPDLRDVFPFGATPHPDRRNYLAWLLHWGPRTFELSAGEALWHLFEADEAPDRGLAATYLLQPSWQEAVPHALTPFGWADLKAYLRKRYGLRGRWFDRAALPPAVSRPWDDLTRLRTARPALDATFPARAAEAGDAAAVLAWVGRHVATPAPPGWRAGLRADVAAGLPGRPGVNVLGHFRYESGLQQAAAGLVAGLDRAGVRTVLRDLPVKFECDWADGRDYRGVELFDTSVSVAAVNTFPSKFMPLAGVHARPGVRRVAVWYWELEDVPAEWAADVRWPDEVWAPTRFTADAFRKVTTAPVVPMLPGVELPAFARKPRAAFGLPDDRVLFLFSFDMGSVMARKNPLAVVAAFRRAFRAGDRAHLAVKVSRGDCNPVGLAQLTAAASDAGVTVIDRVLTRGDALALLASADCYASLHRSEGLGLGMAESMLMGKPVVATAYSGNMDFMTAKTAYLVDYRRVPIGDDPYALSPYPKGGVWADPSVEHAAELMRRVYDRPDDAREVGVRAKAAAERLLSVDASARRMADRLRPPAVAPPAPAPVRTAA